MPLGNDGFSDLKIYKNFFKMSRGLHCMCDFDGNFLDVSQSWSTILGIPQEELLNKPFINLIHPEDRHLTTLAFEKLKNGQSIVHFDNRYIHRDLSIRWMRWHSHLDSEQQIIFASASDVTEEKENLCRAETKVRILRDVFDKAPCLAAVAEGEDLVFTFANEMYLNLVGRRDIIGLPLKEAIPDLDENVLSILKQVYKTGKKFEATDLKMVGDWGADGNVKEKFFTLVYAPLLNAQHEVTGVWTLAFDTTESKMNEKLMHLNERMSALGKLAAGVGHEINNPLTYVIGYLKAISDIVQSDGDQNKSVLEYVKNAEDGVHRIKEIVKSLKDLSREPAEREKTSVILKHVAEVARGYAEVDTKNRADVSIEIDGSYLVNGNENELVQLFLNLILNAAHAITPGAMANNSIKISGEKVSDLEVLVRVKDTGCGIPKEHLEKIFDPFFSLKSDHGGSGLGLSICHNIMVSHKGKIDVESNPGAGTEFKLVFTLEQGPAAVIKAEESERLQLGRSRILIIDDEVLILKALQVLLAEHETTITTSAREALQRITSGESFDAIICDMSMPDMTGQQFLEGLENIQHPLSQKTIMISGGVLTKEYEALSPRVRTRYLEKPFDLEVLKGMLAEIIRPV